MRNLTHAAPLVGPVLFAAVAGCAMGGGTPSVATGGERSDSAAARSHPDVTKYVYTCLNGTVFRCLVYDRRGNIVRRIKRGIASPIGVSTDPAGNLYVADEFGNDVTVYGPGGGPLIATLNDRHDVPVDVAVRRGVVAVANLHNVRVFENRFKSRALSIPNVLQASAVAFDSKGNCYVAFVRDTFGTAIDSYDKCRGHAHEHDVTTGTPYGIAFDGNDNLYFTDLGPDTEGVYSCTGLDACQLLYPQLTGSFYLNFSADFTHLFVSSEGGSRNSSISDVDIASGKIVRTFTKGLDPSNPPMGVAAGPGPPD